MWKEESCTKFLIAFLVGMFLTAIVCSLCLSGEPTTAPEFSVGPSLQEISVNVLAGNAQGSGTIYLVELKDGTRAAFVLTANHVVDGLRTVETPYGTDKKVIRYLDASIRQEQVENGRAVGEVMFDAKVVNVDTQRDIALLRVRKGDFTTSSATLYTGEAIPCVGTPILHCGSPGGIDTGGTATLTSGIISRIGVRISDFGGGSDHGIFEQVDCAAMGGSSGGMICLSSDGRQIGVLTLGLRSTQGFHWVVPARSIVSWAREIEIMWLFDSSLPRPTELDISSIPLEHIASGEVKD